MATTNKYKYIYQLPFTDRKNLCKILDADDKWEELGGSYMKYDVLTIALLKKKDSPTWELLDMWGQKNHTINDLFVLLRNMGHYHAMTVIKHLVDAKYHYLLDDNVNASRYLNIRPTMDSSSLPIPTLPDKNSKVYSYNSSQGACGGVKSKSYQDSVNMHNIYANSKPTYDKPNVAEYALEETDKNKKDDKFQSNKGDSYFLTNKWVPQKKILNDPIISMDENLTLNYTHANKKETNVGAGPATNSDVKINNSRKYSNPENLGLSIRSNDSRVRKSSKEIENALHSTFNIEYKQILFATNDFDPSKLIGRGGFGEVYRGEWKNTQVAIKRLKQKNSTEDTMSDVSMNQSLIELKSLINYRHDNILPLYGVSIGGPEPCLVYQYMLNGSLEDRLLCRNGTMPLMWLQRAKITQGAARGIQFLHTSGEIPLIHGDIKSANILLDSNLEPKIGDFGLAREGPQGHYTHVEVSSLHGTQYYLPQEYLRNRTLSTKVDTYSFGIVLFEISTGLRAFDDRRPNCKLLLEYVHDKHDHIHVIRDVKAGKNYSDWFFQLIELGIECTNKIKKNRPEMVQVLQKLEITWQEEELKERGRKISREGHSLPDNHDLAPVAVQAYYDEQKKQNINSINTQSDGKKSIKVNSNHASVNNSLASSNREEVFCPKGPPSHYVPPGNFPSGVSCDVNWNSGSANNFTLENDSPPPNYYDINSINIPFLTGLGIKENTEDQSSQKSVVESVEY